MNWHCVFCGEEHDWEKPCEKMKAAEERLFAKAREIKRASMEDPKEWPPEDGLIKRWTSCGLECAIAHGLMAYCGYVKVPVGHPDVDHVYDDVDVEIHGGLTFNRRATDGGMWFGFDTGHGGDWTGYVDMVSGLTIESPGRIWTEEDVEKETEKLARQLAARRKK